MMPIVRTTININDALLDELKARAAESGKSLRQVLEDTLRLGLGAARVAGPGRRFRVRAHPLGLKAGFHGTSLNQLYDQLEAEDDATRGRPRSTDASSRVAEDPRS